MWQYFQNNPAGRNVGDCTVRALSVVLGWDWEKAFCELCSDAYYMADMPSSNGVLGAALRKRGFYRRNLPDTCPDCYTIADFCEDHPEGIYVVGTGIHVVGCIDGSYFDSWDSGGEIPVYYWEKKEDIKDEF